MGAAIPKIYVFPNSPGGGDCVYIAMAEDGTCLGSHLCSNERFARSDLGVTPGSRPDRHEEYAKHYPNGYEMEFVDDEDISEHVGLKSALDLAKEAVPN